MMSDNNFAALVCFTMLALLFGGLVLSSYPGNVAAISDSGCSTHPHKVIEQKQIKDTYNYDSLRSE